MIYYQNGMLNNVEIAKGSARYLSELMGEEVGMINNITHGLGKDVREYKSPLGTKDVLTAYEYEKISKTEGRHLVVMHSAGNEDGYKALKVLGLEKRNLGGNIDFMSVGSPIGKEELSKAAEKVGGKLIGQYNNWKDPVTHPKTWITGTLALGVAGLVGGTAAGTAAAALLPESVAASSAVAASTSLGRYFSGLMKIGSVGAGLGAGLGAGGGVGWLNLNKYHSFEKYLERDVKGIREGLKEWQEKNKR